MTATTAFGYPVVADIGGVLVLEVPGVLSPKDAETIKAHIRQAIAREALILAGGLHLAGIITPPEVGTPIYDQLVAERSA